MSDTIVSNVNSFGSRSDIPKPRRSIRTSCPISHANSYHGP